MLRSEQRLDAPLAEQVAFWNRWNAEAREAQRGRVSLDQSAVVCRWLERVGRRDLEILDAGCGAGWLAADLVRFGRVTGTDLSDEVLARARLRVPEARFVAGDIMHVPLATYDVVVSLEVLSHVADQPAFLARLARLLRPGGALMLATQNRPALERNDIPPPQPGQIRRWVDRRELSRLLAGSGLAVEELFSITPQYNRGLLRKLNSERLRRLVSGVGGAALADRLVGAQERLWLGWSLMALARKPAGPVG